MKRIVLIGLALFGFLTSNGASATVETFNGAAGQHGGTFNGFTLDPLVYFNTPGRPYLEFNNVAHSITAVGTFDFNSIELSAYPWDNFSPRSGQLHMQLRGLANEVLLDTFIALPSSGAWVTYANLVEGVHQIYFFATGSFWPSFDNLHYNEGGSDVPEPGSLALLGLGIVGLAASRKLKKK